MADQTPQGWGPPQPPSPAPHPRRRPGRAGWIGIAAGAFVLGVIVTAVAGGNQTTTAARSTEAAATTAATTVTTSPPTTALATTTAAPATSPPTTRQTPTTRKPTPTTRHRPPTTRKPPPTTSAPARNCDPAYPDACLHDGIGDYDCAGGSGNGPNYVDGPVTVRAPDPFGLDSDNDGVGCES
jgi:hypothetical protein